MTLVFVTKMATSSKRTGEKTDDRPPNRSVKNLLSDDLVQMPKNKCQICTSLHKDSNVRHVLDLDENCLLIHLVMFHFEVSISVYFR